jgi:hypothetical protein
MEVLLYSFFTSALDEDEWSVSLPTAITPVKSPLCLLNWRLGGFYTLGRPRRRWEDNIKMDLREVGWGAWTGSVWLRIGAGGGLL